MVTRDTITRMATKDIKTTIMTIRHKRRHINRPRHSHNTKIHEIDEFSECSSDCSDRSDCEESADDQDLPTSDSAKELSSPSQHMTNMPGNLRWHDNSSDDIRQPFSPSNSHVPSHVNNTVNTTDETEIVHIDRNSHNECTVITTTGDRLQKALWDSGADKCVLSFGCYNSTPCKIQN